MAGKEGRVSYLMAHHMELRHVPVVLVIFAAGAWIGSELISKFMKRGKS